MNKKTLAKAKELENDIESIARVLKEYDEQHHWIQVISPRCENGQSARFQRDIAEWLRRQKEIYKKELEDL